MGFVIHRHGSATDLHVFPIPIPPPTSPSTRSLWVFPEHQVRALVSCIQPGLVICFTLDKIRVLMLFSRNIPPSPSPTEPESLFCMGFRKTVRMPDNSLALPYPLEFSPRLPAGIFSLSWLLPLCAVSAERPALMCLCLCPPLASGPEAVREVLRSAHTGAGPGEVLRHLAVR